MNQILITEKIYITPELKRKKKIYKFSFIICIILVIMLFSVYVYAQYDRDKNEEISQDILKNMEYDTTTISKDDEVWVIDLQATAEDVNDNKKSVVTTQNRTSNKVLVDGVEYDTVGSISIPSINVYYPILSETTESLLKVSVCKFWGSNPNEVGNLCIAGHNYRNQKFFSKVPDLPVGDIIEITDLSNNTVRYKIYDIYTVLPNETQCLSQRTNGKTELTLITCTLDSERRIIVKAQSL